LEKDALGTAAEFLPDSGEISALEGEIEVARETLGEAVVRRLIAFEGLRFSRQIERHGEREQEQPEGNGRDRAGGAGRTRGARHAGASEVRNDRSAARIPFRLVARDVSCSSVYRRSILRTNTQMSYCRPVARAAAASAARSSG